MLRCGASREAVAVTALFLSKPEVVSDIPLHVKAGEGSYHGGRLALLRGCPSRPPELAGMIATAYYADTWDVFSVWARRGDTRKCIYIYLSVHFLLPSCLRFAEKGWEAAIPPDATLYTLDRSWTNHRRCPISPYSWPGSGTDAVQTVVVFVLASLSVTCLLDNPFICGTSRNTKS